MVGSPFGFSFGFAAALVFYFLPFVLFFYLRIVRFSTLASMTRPLVIRFNWYIGAWGPAAVANRRDLGTFESGRVAGRRWRGTSSDLCAVGIPTELPQIFSTDPYLLHSDGTFFGLSVHFFYGHFFDCWILMGLKWIALICIQLSRTKLINAI